MTSLVANDKSTMEELIPYLENIVKETDDENIREITEAYIKNIRKNERMDEILLDNNIGIFIDEKIKSFQNKNQTLDEIKKDIEIKVKEKLKQLDYYDKDFKKYLIDIIEKIISKI